MNPKISPDHLKRRAVVYIRQSSPGQVIHNQESQRRQYRVKIQFAVVANSIDKQAGSSIDTIRDTAPEIFSNPVLIYMRHQLASKALCV
jgi:hypothetical protein